MFERFTRDARTAVVLAQEEARQEGSTSIGVLHLLGGVLADAGAAPALVLSRWGVDRRRIADLRAGDDCAVLDGDSEALSALGIDLAQVRRRAEQEFGPGALERRRPRWSRRIASGHIRFSPEAKAALQQSVRSAAFYRDRTIGSTQLFLGLLTDETVVLALSRLGANASTAELIRLVRQQGDQAA